MNDLTSLGKVVRIALVRVISRPAMSWRVLVFLFLYLLTSCPARPLQESVDRESGSGHEHHPQHLQSHPQVSGPADRAALGQPAGGGSAPQLRSDAAVIQHLQVLLSLPLQRSVQNIVST